MAAASLACQSCGARGADVRRLRRLHGPGKADLCNDCVLAHAETRVSRKKTADKIMQIRRALDSGQDVWFSDDELFVMPKGFGRRWCSE